MFALLLLMLWVAKELCGENHNLKFTIQLL